MLIWTVVKAIKYLALLASSKFKRFDIMIGNEKDPKLKYYFLFQKSFMVHEYEKCYLCLMGSLKQGISHWDMVRKFINSILPLLLRDKAYERVEIMARELLRIKNIEKSYRKNLYMHLGNSLYYQKKNQQLAELIDEIELVQKETDHPLVLWYRQGMGRYDKTEGADPEA